MDSKEITHVATDGIYLIERSIGIITTTDIRNISFIRKL